MTDDAPRRHPNRVAADRLLNVARRGTPGSDEGRNPAYKPVQQRAHRSPVRGGSIVVVVHNDDGTVERPLAAVVYWLGSATPENADDQDLWYTADVT